MTAQELAQIIEKCGEQWLLEGEREMKLAHMLGKLNQSYEAFARDFSGDDDIMLNDRCLLAESELHRVRALLQALPTRSPQFIAGIWRIIQGDRIASISLEYVSRETFVIRVEIESQRGHARWKMESDQIEDAAFLRHVSIGRIDDKPFFAGYFAVRAPR